MSKPVFNSLQRVLTTLDFKEPDKVPLFLFLTLHGAKELGMSIEQYFSKAENVVKGQLILRSKYNNDCLFSFFYASLEIEAFGGNTIFFDDGPPNSGKPIIQNPEDIYSLEPPNINEAICLQKPLAAIKSLKEKSSDEIPIIGIAISPFSLPVMQMGFGKYIELIYENPEAFDNLMSINMEFCIEWANAQLDAGATAIGYFDPVSSPTILPKEKYIETGYKISKSTISKIKGPTAIHLASGRVIEIVDNIIDTHTNIIGVSSLEDLVDLKNQCKNKITLLGNLNGIEMMNWTQQQAENAVKQAISKAGPGGGFILSDNHGEIPYQVPDEVLHAISNAVDKWGKYPLKWIGDED